MLIRVLSALLAFSFIALAPAQCQDQPASADSSPTIATDRPSFTNSSVVVPNGGLQFENGFLETYNQGQNVVDGPESLLRLGIAAKTELRFTVPDYFYNASTGGGPPTGSGDMAIGLKQQLGPVAGFDVSATVFVGFPTGAKNVSSGGYDPGLQVAWSRAITSKWTAAGQLAMYWPTQGSSRNPTGQATILLDRQITGPWDAFIEYAGNFPTRNGTRQFMHAGTSIKLAKTQQLDFQFGQSMTGTAERIVGVGYSFRFQAFHRN
jgi:hypothetical protein